MATTGESSVTPQYNKPVIVRVKRKAFQSRVDGFWLEINERPTKRAMLDLEKLSISNSVDVQVEEVKVKKIFVKHVETVTSRDTTMEIVQSCMSTTVSVVDEQKQTIEKDSKQEQILSSSKQNQEVLASNTRFEQIWRNQRRNKEASEDKALNDMCHFYDVVRVEDSSNQVQEHADIPLEDQEILSRYLPILREFLPSAVAEVESDIRAYMSNQQVVIDDYVYDYYTMKDDMDIDDTDASNPFPLVKVEDEDFYDGPDDASEYDTDDSNAEDHPRNDYPDESSLEDDESESEESHDESEDGEEEEEEEDDDSSGKHSEFDDSRLEIVDGSFGYGNDFDDDNDGSYDDYFDYGDHSDYDDDNY